MSTTSSPAGLSPGQRVTFRDVDGDLRQARVKSVEHDPRWNAHANYRIVVAFDGVTRTITGAALL